MHQNSLLMKKIILASGVFLLLAGLCIAQIPLTTAPNGGNKKASVSERIGLTDVTIHYDRPGVKGREGKVWGQLVHVGFIDQQFGSSKSAPWRAGANENTTIEFSNAVKIEGQTLPAGKYGFFIAYEPANCTLIFSRNANSWGSYFYDEKEDALRVKVKPQALDKNVEWLKYEFADESETGATVVLSWEKLAIPFRVETDYVNDQLNSFRRELRTERGFIWQGWDQAAQWCLQRNTNLDQALRWADSATSINFGGDRMFTTWSTKAQLLEKLGRSSEASDIMKKAMAFANMNEMHQYGRQFLTMKKNKEALEIFKTNHDKNPGQFTTLVGLTRGYSANGDTKTALKYANQALTLAPDPGNKTNVETMIGKLKEGKDVN
jgi:tetratricopeptide (TPR) repeat protein